MTSLAIAVEALVRALDENLIHSPEGDDNLTETPRRVREAYEELLYGHSRHASLEIIKYLGISFPTKHNEMIMIRGTQGAGLCPHHLLPVLYTVNFAYIPHGKALGLSKVPRIINLICAQAKLQEDITSEIAETFWTSSSLEPKGVAVVVQGFHSCMSVRGIQEHDASTVTSAMRGCFLDDQDTSKLEFFELLKTAGGVAWSGR